METRVSRNWKIQRICFPEKFIFDKIFFFEKNSHQSPLMGGEKNFWSQKLQNSENVFSAKKRLFGRFFSERTIFSINTHPGLAEKKNLLPKAAQREKVFSRKKNSFFSPPLVLRLWLFCRVVLHCFFYASLCVFSWAPSFSMHCHWFGDQVMVDVLLKKTTDKY